MNKKQQFAQGAKLGVPVVFGFVPVGIAYAIMARQAGFSIAQTIGMSVAVFAGASQMMAVGMYAAGAGLAAMIITTFMLNLRHVIMSVCVFDRLRGVKMGKKLSAAFGVTDEGFAIFTTLPKEQATFPTFVGVTVVTYLSWVLGAVLGAFASDLLPPLITASLGIALYAMFLGMLTPSVPKNPRLGLLILLTALCNSLLTLVIDDSPALILSSVICAAVGVFFVDPEGEKK